MLTYPFSFKKIKAIFLKRQNRFTVEVIVNSKKSLAYLPNPGRLWELLIPNTEVLIVKNHSHTKLPYTLLACKKHNTWILLHTHLTNKIVKSLLLNKRLPFWSDWEFLKEEVNLGKGRIDFLLRNITKDCEKFMFLEVKTCTLLGKNIGMFPDAETKRGTRHIQELANLNPLNQKGALLFVIMNPDISFFMPAFHVDLTFSKNLIDLSKKLDIRAISLGFDENFEKVSFVKEVKIPFKFIEKELRDSGSYLIWIFLDDSKDIVAGKKSFFLEKGYYIYVGSAKKGLISRINRHLRKKKKLHWHIDYLTKEAKKKVAIPIRSYEPLECIIAKRLANLGKPISGFGSSDCKCNSHLFYFEQDPLKDPKFQELLIDFRINRLTPKLLDNLSDKEKN